MEKQPPAPQPIPPVQTPPALQKPVFPWKIVVLVILVIALSVGITLFLVKGFSIPFLSQTKPAPNVVKNPQPTIPTANTTDWKTYADEKAGFSLQYPNDVILNAESKGATQNILSISSEPIDQIKDQPIYGGKEEAIKDKEALAKGELTGASFAADVQVVNLGPLNGKESTILSQFEVCSVMFYKTLTFYPNNYRVLIGFSGVKEQIVAQMPDYFKIDAANCGDQKVWNLDKTQAFVQALKNHQGSPSAQNWHDAFEQIIKTIKITPVADITPQQICDYSDQAFCTILSQVKSAVASKDITSILPLINPQSTTCDPDGMYTPICDGVPKGVVKQGYMVGYHQSEGAVYDSTNFIKAVNNYLNSNNTIKYQDERFTQNKSIIVFLDSDQKKLLAFPIINSGSWKISYLILGNATNDFINLDETILGNF